MSQRDVLAQIGLLGKSRSTSWAFEAFVSSVVQQVRFEVLLRQELLAANRALAHTNGNTLR